MWETYRISDNCLSCKHKQFQSGASWESPVSGWFCTLNKRRIDLHYVCNSHRSIHTTRKFSQKGETTQ